MDIHLGLRRDEKEANWHPSHALVYQSCYQMKLHSFLGKKNLNGSNETEGTVGWKLSSSPWILHLALVSQAPFLFLHTIPHAYNPITSSSPSHLSYPPNPNLKPIIRQTFQPPPPGLPALPNLTPSVPPNKCPNAIPDPKTVQYVENDCGYSMKLSNYHLGGIHLHLTNKVLMCSTLPLMNHLNPH